MEDCWYDNWAFIYEENIAPLLIGEWGGFIDEEHDADGKNTKWMTYLRDYMIEKHIHHTFWCFNENSGDTGGLVYDNFSTWDEAKYALVKPALWQTEDGAFIGLDHEIPLGVNGVSLGEYTDGKTTPGTTAVTDEQGNPATVTTAKPILQGDFNSDGKLNALDVVIFKRYIIGHTDLETLDAEIADFNRDGTVNIADLVAIIRYLTQEKT